MNTINAHGGAAIHLPAAPGTMGAGLGLLGIVLTILRRSLAQIGIGGLYDRLPRT